jgi:hypothetical protein
VAAEEIVHVEREEKVDRVASVEGIGIDRAVRAPAEMTVRAESGAGGATGGVPIGLAASVRMATVPREGIVLAGTVRGANDREVTALAEIVPVATGRGGRDRLAIVPAATVRRESAPEIGVVPEGIVRAGTDRRVRVREETDPRATDPRATDPRETDPRERDRVATAGVTKGGGMIPDREIVPAEIVERSVAASVVRTIRGRGVRHGAMRRARSDRKGERSHVRRDRARRLRDRNASVALPTSSHGSSARASLGPSRRNRRRRR